MTVTNDAGGWSLEIPDGWYHRPGPQRGLEMYSHDPRGMVNNDGNDPPDGDVSMRLQMFQNPDGLTPAEFSRWFPSGIGSNVVDRRQVLVGGEAAESYGVSPTWLPNVEIAIHWFVRSPFFADRMVVITAVPTTAQRRADSERVVGSLRFHRPVLPHLVPTLSRSEIVQRVTTLHRYAFTRIEAKAVVRKELEAARALGREFYSDPDSLAWVVLYAGENIPIFRPSGGPFIPGAVYRPPPPCRLGITIVPADGLPGSSSSGCLWDGEWPRWFDLLIDRDRIAYRPSALR